MITDESWYDANPDPTNCYQGDILSDFPFLALPTFLPASKQDVWGILRPNPRSLKGRGVAEVMRTLPVELIGRAAKDCPDAWTLTDGEYVIANCKKTRIMVISRSCDIDKPNRKHFLVAPVTAVHELQPVQRTDDKLRDLRANDIYHWFYLPAKEPNLPESFADLTQMLPLHRSFFDGETLTKSLAARLSARATAVLQKSLSDFYGTTFGFTSADVCPQSAHYGCVSCFHAGQATPRSNNIERGQRFGNCELCGEEALWVKTSERR